jgi:hypothetical protein
MAARKPRRREGRPDAPGASGADAVAGNEQGGPPAQAASAFGTFELFLDDDLDALAGA